MEYVGMGQARFPTTAMPKKKYKNSFRLLPIG